MEAAVSTATLVSRKPRARDKHSRYCRTFPRFGICCSHVPSCLRRYSEVHGAPFVVVEKNVTNMSTAEHRFVDVLDETVIVRRRAATRFGQRRHGQRRVPFRLTLRQVGPGQFSAGVAVSGCSRCRVSEEPYANSHTQVASDASIVLPRTI